MTDQNKIFISYRRSISQDRARLIFRELRERGYDVFLDVTTIDSGAFDRIILNQIAARPHFLLILSPGSLERCVNEGDWLLREIEEAFHLKRNIVPVFDEKFDVDHEKHFLPEPLRSELPRLNAPPYSHYYFDAFIETICTRFLKPPVYDIPITPPPAAEQAEAQRRIDQIAQTTVPPRHEMERGLGGEVSPRHVVESDQRESLREGAGGEVGVRADAAAVRAIIGDPFEWCAVPAGEFLYGDDKQKLTLPAFAIAKYPITYRQFRTFIDAKDGFHDPRWWEGLAKRSDEPGNQEWKIADHPRENVSWYEAVAFCRWLSFRLGGSYDLAQVAAWAVRLPTEFEWEKAARGTGGRMYPWGNMFDEAKANTLESGVGKTTPVTAYPQGASPYDVLDMAGNVWEWCLSDYDNPVLDVTDENARFAIARVLRGGSWNALNDGVRAAKRSNYNPVRNDITIGFRICRP